MSIKKDFKVILKNECGVALMMIMTAIVILMAVYSEFTFESKISRIKATNILDRSQAKLLAESGLALAMARIRLYKEAYNYVQSNQNAKNLVPDQLLNQIWEVPFMYPIPVTKKASMAVRSSVDKFQKDTFLDGEMKVSVQNISNRFNLNMLRVDMTKIDPNSTDWQNPTILDMNDTAILNNVSIDQTLFFLLKKLVDEKKEKDDAFRERYGNLNYQMLITNLKYYMSDYQSMNQDPLAGEAESNFQRIPLTPKFGPIASASELYAIPGWTDELIELIKNEFSVYPTTQIDFNKLTANMLRILIPNINEDEVREFFLWRDDPEQPKTINSLADFKRYVVTQERWMNENDFDERMKKFQEKGISFGANPNLLKVVSEGIFNRSTYTLVAYVALSKNESPASGSACPDGQIGTPPNCRPRNDSDPPPSAPSTGGANQPNQNAQLLEPRIIEIQIN